MLLIGNGKVRDTACPYIPDGAVVTDGEAIREVGSLEAMKAKYPEAEFVDAKGGIIMPGLINAHTHIYSGLARGLAIEGHNPTNFFEILDGMWWNIDRHLTLDGTKASAYATILDCIRDGVTTIFDHHASFCEIPGSLFVIKDAAKELGIRSCLCYEVSERDGEEKCDEAIKENADFAKWAAKEDDELHHISPDDRLDSTKPGVENGDGSRNDNCKFQVDMQNLRKHQRRSKQQNSCAEQQMQAIENRRNSTHGLRKADFKKFIGAIDARSAESRNKDKTHHHNTDEGSYLEHEEGHVVAIHIGRSTEERRSTDRRCNKANAYRHPRDRAATQHVFFEILVPARNKQTDCNRKQQVSDENNPIK